MYVHAPLKPHSHNTRGAHQSLVKYTMHIMQSLDTNNALDQITYMYTHELIRYSHDMYTKSLRQDKARRLCLKTTPLTLGRLSPDEQGSSVHVLVNDM